MIKVNFDSKLHSKTEFVNELQAQVAHHGLTYHVGPEGPINAKVAIFGEGPGETEARQGRPWVGGAGRLLWDALRPHNIHRANCYASNVVKRQISLSRKGDERHSVTRGELERWITLFNWELQQLNDVQIIFALGNYVLEALAIPGTDKSGITKWRGSVLDHILPNGRPVKVVLSINPAYAIREPTLELPFKQDCHKLHLVSTGRFKPHDVEVLINPTFTQSIDYIDTLIADKLPVSYDLENMYKPFIVCFGLSNNPHHAISINLRDAAANRFTLDEEVKLHLKLQELFNTTRIVAQNANFDAYFTWYMNWVRFNAWADPMLGHHTLYPKLPHDLGFLVTQYTTHPYYKDEGKKWREGGDLDSYWRYNGLDAALTVAVTNRIVRELEQQGLSDFFFNHVMRLAPYLVEATVHGVAIDPDARQRAIVESAAALAEKEKELSRLARYAANGQEVILNWGSSRQVADFWFSDLSLRGRSRSTDAANREHILKNPKTSPAAKEMLTAFAEWKKESKFNSTYASMRLDPDGRFRTVYKQQGVVSAPGRLSSEQNQHGTAMNIQNQPERARQQFIADPGTVFVYFDLAQAEARVVAYLANIEKWKDQFERARLNPGTYDAHRALCAEMYGMPYDETPAKDFDLKSNTHTKRYIAKRCRHGLNYRMQESRLAEVTKLPYHEARQAFSLYHRATPELRAWWGETERLFRINRELWTPMGRRFKILGRLDDDTLRSLVALVPQSTIGDKVKQVWYQSMEDERWPRGKARIALNNHDSLIAISDPDCAELVAKIMVHYAELPIKIRSVWSEVSEDLIIPAEAKISKACYFDEEKRVWVEDETLGVHRWSHLTNLDLGEKL